MVQHTAHFAAKIIDATTNVPFREHKREDGQIFVEVEPDADYYIYASCSSDPEEGPKICAEYEVDGAGLGYYSSLWEFDNQDFAGFCIRQKRKHTETSLKFKNTSINTDTSSGLQLLMGKIVVTFSTAVLIPMKKEKDFQTTLAAQNVEHSTKAVETVKGCVPLKRSPATYTTVWSEETKRENAPTTFATATSSEDSSEDLDEDSSDDENKFYRYTHGRVIKTIVLNYCSTLGLIHHKILPKPPLWDIQRLHFPIKRETSEDPTDSVRIEPKKIKITREMNGITIGADKYIDFFDLTEHKSSD
uniref:Uncharacterized protein n=1 Tax=Corethron hystrix TaxID=216773 RepID=A0A7S1BBG6_9STRA|mmetsp:Transcript_20684/g.46921  ORF Transcript_20684/g.46921 Transcript_20684/m.46921 type:complete len:303 (+) Transcript_20684:93-1001(+)